jgi:hypothetical protein
MKSWLCSDLSSPRAQESSGLKQKVAELQEACDELLADAKAKKTTAEQFCPLDSEAASILSCQFGGLSTGST